MGGDNVNDVRGEGDRGDGASDLPALTPRNNASQNRIFGILASASPPKISPKDVALNARFQKNTMPLAGEEWLNSDSPKGAAQGKDAVSESPGLANLPVQGTPPLPLLNIQQPDRLLEAAEAAAERDMGGKDAVSEEGRAPAEVHEKEPSETWSFHAKVDLPQSEGDEADGLCLANRASLSVGNELSGSDPDMPPPPPGRGRGAGHPFRPIHLADLDRHDNNAQSFVQLKTMIPPFAGVREPEFRRRRYSEPELQPGPALSTGLLALSAGAGISGLLIATSVALLVALVPGVPGVAAAACVGFVESCLLAGAVYVAAKRIFHPREQEVGRPRFDSNASPAANDLPLLREDVSDCSRNDLRGALSSVFGGPQDASQYPSEYHDDEAAQSRASVPPSDQPIEKDMFMFVTLKDITVLCAQVRISAPEVALMVNLMALIASVLPEEVFVISGDHVVAVFDGESSRLERTIKRCFELEMTVMQVDIPLQHSVSLQMGVCADGQMLSGRISRTFAFFSEAAKIAHQLADLCRSFEVPLLLAAADPPVFQDLSLSATQVDLLTFDHSDGPLPIYTVECATDLREGPVAAALALMVTGNRRYAGAVDEGVVDACTTAWTHIRAGTFLKGKQVISGITSRVPWVQAMKRRVADIVTVSHYRVMPKMTTALATYNNNDPVDDDQEDDAGNDLEDLEDEKEKRMLFMVLYMPERKYITKLREVMISFMAAVSKHDGEVDNVSSDRFAARWRVDPPDSPSSRIQLQKVATTVRHLTSTLPQGNLHIGIAFGTYTTVVAKGIKTIMSDGRNRAMCLAMLASKYNMSAVVESSVLLDTQAQAPSERDPLSMSVSMRRRMIQPQQTPTIQSFGMFPSIDDDAPSPVPHHTPRRVATSSLEKDPPRGSVSNPLIPAMSPPGQDTQVRYGLPENMSPVPPLRVAADEDDDLRSNVSDESFASSISNAKYMSPWGDGPATQTPQTNVLCRKLTSTAFFSFVETCPVNIRKRRTNGSAALPKRADGNSKSVALFEVITDAHRAQAHNARAALYGKALRRIRERSWEKAREILGLYNSLREGDPDPWAAFLLAQVRQAIYDEENGKRESDDDLEFHINMLGDVEAHHLRLDDSQLSSSFSFEGRGGTLGLNGDELFTTSTCPEQASQTSTGRRKSKLLKKHDLDRGGTPNLGNSAYASMTSQARASTPADADTLLDRRSVREYLGMAVSVYRHTKFGSRQITVYNLWNLVRLVLLTIDCLLTPARSASLANRDMGAGTISMIALGYITDMVYFVDILQNFHEPVTNDLGVLINDPREIRDIYLRGWFSFDVLGMLPWELVMMLATGNWQLLAQHPEVRLNRLTNMLRMPNLTHAVNSAFFPEVHPVLTKVFVHLFVVLMILFWIGCLWNYCMWDFVFDIEGNTVPAPKRTTDGILLDSLRGFHWSFRGFAGYGQPWPVPDEEYLPALVNVIFGIGAFATVIAYTHSTLGMTHDAVFQERLDDVVQSAEEKNVGKETTKQLLKYHWMLWEKTGQVYRGQFDELLHELPRDLIMELTYFANIRALKQIPSLMAAGDVQFIANMACDLEHMFCFPSEMLIEQGEPFNSEKMGVFFLIKGTLTAEANNAVIETVTPGSFWGELPCILHDPHSESGMQPASLVVSDYSEIYFLPYSTFRDLFEQYPAAAEVFVETSNRRRQAITSSVEAREQEEVNELNQYGSNEACSEADTVALQTPVMRVIHND
eukprot:TRINITY_DN2142_c0_g1_i1.p1 TRINITY_DN2142_c0_g1~~TRINITY_DN2142_c0_g1_i1.p1  ORF type:complete len:1722 (+),score=437.51 TRINITY_DN2142_c0_g1_i1:154-5319(+)